ERTDHMARLVEDLLLASRISNPAERRMPDVNRQEVDIAPVVERALRSFRVAHPTREFRVRGSEGITCSADPIRVEQIVANLISNAVKFSEEGTFVDVSLSQDTRETFIEVTDEGRGIPSDKFDEIFERFRRLEDPMKMETGGAGLGLFIVRELARAMGGAVSVRSELGHGSTFSVSLPAVGVKPSEQPQRRAQDRQELPVDSQWANVTDPAAEAG
ncbi:MAG: sensor histidine kinase, partial [Actinomycetota bacterium]